MKLEIISKHACMIEHVMQYCCTACMPLDDYLHVNALCYNYVYSACAVLLIRAKSCSHRVQSVIIGLTLFSHVAIELSKFRLASFRYKSGGLIACHHVCLAIKKNVHAKIYISEGDEK